MHMHNLLGLILNHLDKISSYYYLT